MDILEQVDIAPVTIDSFDGEHRFLSNFHVQDKPIVVDGLVFDSVEAAYQAAKTLDPVARARFQELTPFESKKFGRRLDLREDWEDVKVGIMEELVRYKFNSDNQLAQKLIETFPAMLVEGNWWGDRFWGVCRKNHAGQNHLGRILMKVREELMGTLIQQRGESNESNS